MKRLLLSISAMLFIAAPAMAASPGDIIRASWLTVASGFPNSFMIGDKSTRMVIPDTTTDESWGSPSSQTVDAEQLSQLTLTGALPIREGSKLVKFGMDPQVYAVGPRGALHWISSEALASQLYGENWNKNIVMLPTSFYPNYTLATPIIIPRHPNGTLLRYAGSTTVFYLVNGIARPFADDGAIRANNFNLSSVLTVSNDFSYVHGNPINGLEQDLNLNLAPKTL